MIRGSNAASLVLAREEPTQSQKMELAAKIAELKSQGLTPTEAYRDLHTGRWVDNPEPRAMVPRTEWAPDELKNLLLQAVDPNTGAPVWLTIRALEQSQNPQLAALGALRQAGILSDDLYTAIVKQPDPGWQPVVWEPPFVETVLGTDAALEWSEFVELWG